MKKIKIFWTGGWDSTFRIVELSIKKVEILPIYIVDKGRSSWKREIETMNKIVVLLQKIEKTNAKFLPIEIIEREKINTNLKITEAYNNIRKEVKLGSQYEWLARYAANNPGIELGIEKTNVEYSGCIAVVEKFGRFKKDEDGILIIDKDNSCDDLIELFGNFKFPIANITETEMVKKIIGYEDVMKNIWFCHTPVNNEPCGYCRPCQQKMKCEMEFLLPNYAQKQYKEYKKVCKIFEKKLHFVISN